MKIHELKTWPEFYEAILQGRKTFEIRLNDRDFKVNDLLVLKEYEPIPGVFTGRKTLREVSYVTTFGQRPGWVVMGLIMRK
jgi:ASC-1-like (ASCH) protein